MKRMFGRGPVVGAAAWVSLGGIARSARAVRREAAGRIAGEGCAHRRVARSGILARTVSDSPYGGDLRRSPGRGQAERPAGRAPSPRMPATPADQSESFLISSFCDFNVPGSENVTMSTSAASRPRRSG